jgi:hypothetical protein
MSDLIAKAIVKDRYWVITDGNKKVGNVVASNVGFDVKINGNSLSFTNTTDLKKKTNIRFQPVKSDRSVPNLPYPEYPTPRAVYNSVMDIKRKLHLFTTDPDSKCLQAAGWFVIDHGDVKQVTFCPKYIFVQRYPYLGPFKTEREANAVLNTV